MRIRQKIDGYRRRAHYEWNLRKNAVAAEKRKTALGKWFARLAADPPDVLIGANLIWGGVRHHIHAIQHFSTLNVGLAPGEGLFQLYPNQHIGPEFYEEFSQFKSTNIKVVHSHVFPWFINWCSARKENGIRWVHTYHNHYYPEFVKDGVLEPWQEEINSTLLNIACFADVRLSVSRWQVKELQQEHGIETQYLPNGVDVTFCEAALGSRFIRKTGLENFILWVGRNDPVKNPLEFAQLAALLPEQRFVMIGGGLSAETLRESWRVEVPRNLCVLGPMSHADVQDAIAACSVLVMTSKREGLPTLVMEGMAQGKPVVVPNERGCMEVIGQGEAGLFYEAGQIDDLARQTLSAKTSYRLGDIGRTRVRKEYDWRIVAPRLDAIYKGAAA